MKRSVPMSVSALVAGVLLAGCSPTVTGGDTTCKDFLNADEQTQTDAVAAMLEDEKGTEAANLEITGTRLSVVTFCQTAGKQDSKIKEAPHL